MLVPGEYYLVKLAKKRIVQNVPIQIAISILNLAKISLLRFVHEFVFKFFKNRTMLGYIDTDSCSFAASKANLDDMVDECDKDDYLEAKRQILAIGPDEKL